MRPEKILFHLANLIKKLGGKGGGKASFLLNQGLDQLALQPQTAKTGA